MSRFVLYRFYDSTGALLYIGATSDFAMRMAQHAQDKHWWPEVADVRLEHFDSYDELAAEEVEAIKSEDPRHNIIHGPAPNPSAGKPRAPRGTGSLFQRADGLWIGRVELPPQGGKRKYKTVSSRDYTTAAAKFDALTAAFGAPTAVADPPPIRKRPACTCGHAHSNHPAEGPCSHCDCSRYREKRRRARGDGGLFQRADGMWIGRVELPRGRDGERRTREVSSKDFAIASRELRKLRTAVDDGRIAVTGSATVEKWLDRWINEIHSKRKIRPGTIVDYRAIITNHIVPAIGKKRIEKLTPQHIREMHTAIGARRTAVVAHAILQKALNDAMREGMITRNVAELVDKPEYAKIKRTSLSFDIAKRIIGTAFASRDKSEATRWAAAFLTGCRQAELLGLEWDRVDLEHGFMEVSWQLQQLPRVHGCGGTCGLERAGWCPQARWDLPPSFEYRECYRSLVWTLPKTEAGERRVPIIPELLAELRELHGRQGANPHGLVWHYPDGRPIGPREDYKRWKALLIEAQIIKPKGETLALHVARHTTATMLRAAGVDEQTRMEILGHATVDSQRVYAHGDQARHLSAMTNLSQLLS